MTITLHEGHAVDVLRRLPAGRPSRTALRYYGGKASVADWIVSHFPPHQSYVEPFGGAASVLLAKPRAIRETYNDLDGAVVAFFRCLRDSPDALVRAIELTPFARAEVDGADVDDPAITDLERARRLYVRSWQTIHGAPSRGRMGWRCEKGHTGGGTSADAWGKTAHLYDVAARLQGVQIEQKPALDVLARFDQPAALHYVDPPYVTGTRGDRWAKVAYAVEMRDDQHAALADALHHVEGMVVLSGYHSALYDELYSDWVRVEHRARQQSREVATEVLWLSPRAVQGQQRLPLFAEVRVAAAEAAAEAAAG